MSVRDAEREHARIMEGVNKERGAVQRAAVKGKTFQDAVNAWRLDIAPVRSPATVRQHECYLRKHIIPKFGEVAPDTIDIRAVQQFAVQLRETLSRKTVINILGAMFAILKHAPRCGIPVSKVSFADVELGTTTNEAPAAYFTRAQAAHIIAASPEPYKTMFTVAWVTGLRAGELLALNVADLDFVRKAIQVNKSADEHTRKIRQPKTKQSTALLPMPSTLEATLRAYLKDHWRPNVSGLLFPNRKGTHPRWRDNVVKYGLRPVLRKLGISSREVGLHAFRHGLATELAEALLCRSRYSNRKCGTRTCGPR